MASPFQNLKKTVLSVPLMLVPKSHASLSANSSRPSAPPLPVNSVKRQANRLVTPFPRENHLSLIQMNHPQLRQNEEAAMSLQPSQMLNLIGV
jgi:hypothetical protein